MIRTPNPSKGRIFMSDTDKKPAATVIPLSPTPKTLEEAISQLRPVVDTGGKPLDTVTVYCTGGNPPKQRVMSDGKGGTITIITCG
jgi:hypothetical protein